MDLGAIILLILVFLLILFFVTRPFFVHQQIRPVEKMEKKQKLSSLLAERERLLAEIQELDSDQALEKISAIDYSSQRVGLLHKGAEVLRQIDAMSMHSDKGQADQTEVLPVMTSPGPVEVSDDELEELLARRRALRKDKTGGFCPKCGKPVLFSDAFCPSCGYALK